jgi:hypothetical protein
VFLILPGVTANHDRIEAVRKNAESLWGEARIEVPNYLSRHRGVRGVGAWLDRWCSGRLGPDDEVYVFAFILGTAALPYAPKLLALTKRMVVLRSRFQEGVPYALRRRLGYLLTALFFGRAVADLGKLPVWPAGFAPAVPTLTLLETRATPIAERLGVGPLSNRELSIVDVTEIPVDHDHAYFSSTLLKIAVDFLRESQGPMEKGNDLGMSQ